MIIQNFTSPWIVFEIKSIEDHASSVFKPVISTMRNNEWIPNKYTDKYHWETERKQFETKHGQIYTKCFYKKVFDGYETIPAHTEIHSMFIKEIPRKPYLKILNARKK